MGYAVTDDPKEFAKQLFKAGQTGRVASQRRTPARRGRGDPKA
jgi:hypothetical protein